MVQITRVMYRVTNQIEDVVFVANEGTPACITFLTPAAFCMIYFFAILFHELGLFLTVVLFA